MKLTANQMQKIAKEVHKSLLTADKIKVTESEEKIKSLVVAVLKKNIEEERLLDEDVNNMMDTLEKQNPGAFERYKMFPLLKKKLAQQKGFVL